MLKQTGVLFLAGVLAYGCGKEPSSARSSSGVGLEAAVQTGYIATPFGTGSVSYQRLDAERALIEGDILMDTAEISDEASSGGLNLFTNNRLWPDATVVYELDAKLPANLRSAFNAAINEWSQATGVKWIPRTQEAGYVDVQYNAAHPTGWAHIGYWRQGRTEMVLGPNCLKSCILHEAGHTLGLWHEHTRPDRDEYLTVDLTGISDGNKHNYDKVGLTGGSQLLSPFDYHSVMMYGASKHIRRKDGGPLGSLGKLSDHDIRGVRQLYRIDTQRSGGSKGEGTKMAPTAPTDPKPADPTVLPDSQMGAVTIKNERALCLQAARIGLGVELDACRGDGTKFTWLGASLVHSSSGQCLAATGNYRKDHTPLQLAACNGSLAQQFKVEGSQIKQKDSGRCLDLGGGRLEAGATLYLGPCTGRNNQIFTVQR